MTKDYKKEAEKLLREEELIRKSREQVDQNLADKLQALVAKIILKVERKRKEKKDGD